MSPSKIENVIYSLPAVALVAVAGIGPTKLTEKVTAFVKPKEGYEVTHKEIEQLVRGKLLTTTSFSIISCVCFISGQLSEEMHLSGGVVFVDNIIMSPAGKVYRRKLKELYDGKI